MSSDSEKPETKTPKAKPETKPKSKTSETKTPKAKPETKPETKTETKPETKTETKPETKTPETKPETKPAPTAPAKPETKPVAKTPENEEPDLPAFEKSQTEKITAQFGEKTTVAFIKENRIQINVDKQDIHSVAKFIRDELNYDHVESVSGVDYPQDNQIEVVYHIGSYSDSSLANQVLALSTRAPREENPIPGNDASKLPTLRDIFYSVEFHEREVFEMFGIYFEGHPDNRRLLLPEDWADLPPLRKDFAIKGR